MRTGLVAALFVCGLLGACGTAVPDGVDALCQPCVDAEPATLVPAPDEEAEEPARRTRVTSVAAFAMAKEARVVSVELIDGKDLARVSSLEAVEDLTLWDCTNIAEDFFDSVVSCRRLRKLTMFGLHESVEWRHLAKLAALPWLEYLSVECVSSRGVEAIGELVELKELRIDVTEGFDGGSFSALRKCTQLESLGIRSLIYPEVADFDFISSLEQLTDLQLRSTGFGPGFASTICTLTNLVKLEVGFSGCSDTDVLPLLKLSNLKSLKISAGHGVSDEFYRRLIAESSIERLSLRLPDSVEGAFVTALNSARHLRYLSISGALWESRIAHWVQLKECPTLETITIGLSELGDPKELFLALARMKNLANVYIDASQTVTEGHLLELLEVDKLAALVVTHLHSIDAARLSELVEIFRKKFGKQLRVRLRPSD